MQYDLSQAQLQLESDVLETKKALKGAQKRVIERLAERPFNSKNVIDARMDVAELSNGLKALEQLQKELFPNLYKK